MGYYLMPEAATPEFNVQLIAAEATRVFIEKHGPPTEGLKVGCSIKRQIVQVTDKATGESQWYTFAELGFV